MWVVYFKDQACFWLVGGELYTVGKKDCHIIIKDDASISRKHITLEVGMLQTREKLQQQARKQDGEMTDEEEKERWASIILTDVSTYGTEICTSSLCCKHPNREQDDDNDDDITRELQLCRTSGIDVGNPDDDDDDHDAAVVAGRRFKLPKGKPFCVPCDDLSWREFLITLGTHGASLRLKWVPMRVFTAGVAVEQQAELECSLQRCGVDVVKNFNRADYLVTSSLTPTPVAIAALCRAVDIVTPAYFKTMRDRSGPNVPPPDPRAFTPPLASFWTLLWNDDNGAKDDRDKTRLRLQGEGDGEGRLLYPPNRLARRQLFADLTFVTVQRSLYREVRVFLPCAQGTVVFDESLLEACDEGRREQVVSFFYSQHYRHVILYNSRERFPFCHFARILREQLGLCCVEYLDVIKSIAQAVPLTLPPFPTSSTPKLLQENLLGNKKVDGNEGGELTGLVTEVATRAAGVKRSHKARSSDGRRTDPNPLFGEILSDTEAEVRTVHADQQEQQQSNNDDDGGDDHLTRSKQKREEMDGWVCRKLEADPDAKDLVVVGVPVLPPYPCFQPYIKDIDIRRVGAIVPPNVSTSVASGGKCFRKQVLTVCSDTVEMDRSIDAPGNAVPLVIRAIDADDIIPESLGDSTTPSSRLHFNVFDATAHHHQLYKRTATTRRRVTQRNVSNEVPISTKMTSRGNDMTVGLASLPGRKGNGGASVNIFDMDAFF